MTTTWDRLSDVAIVVLWAAVILLVLLAAPARADDAVPPLRITSKASLLHLGSIDSFDRTPGGIEAAKYLLQAIDAKRPEPARAALDVYARITPKENFGGEYTALAWFAEYLLAPAAERERMVADRFVGAYFHFFADDDFATLREYLKRKYKIEKLDDDGTPKAHRRLGFLEDFILFNNPRREQWEKSNRMIAALGLKPGMSVADVGCGPGYFSFQFAERVGREGRVYAIDTNDLHVDYVGKLARRLGIENVVASRGSFDDLQLDARVDCAYMCSLYHIIYAMSPERSKDRLLASIRKVLKPDGTLVVVDNALVEDQTLPYHGPYIAKELIIGQLRHYGFRHVATHQFIPQRYMLVFKPDATPIKPGDAPLVPEGDGFRVGARTSLIHIPNDAIPDVSRGGREAARLFLAALQKHDLTAARAAAARYAELIPREKFGDEYTAFQWFCEYLLAPAAEQQRLRAPKYRAEYFQLLADNDFAVLKEYLTNRYRPDRLDQEIGPYGATEDTNYRPHVNEDLMSFWRDFILFNNPRREAWEKTEKIIEFLKLKPGQSVADVGCGPGFYAFKFAEIVGREGRVFAVDTNQEHLSYVARLAGKYAPNVETVAARLNDTRLPADSVDVAFMCSLYGVIYTTSLERVKDEVVESIRKSLRKGGRLVIADNAVVRPGELPYHGPYIAKELIVGQMRHYGFRLVDSAQFIPQRYVLVFEGE